MKRLRHLFSLLGLLGIVVCASAAVVVSSMGSRLNKASENVFDGVDKSLVAVRDRVFGAQKRVQGSKITTEEIGRSLRNWTREETSERIASRLKVGEKAADLAQRLRQADVWLEMSEASILGVQHSLKIARSLDAPVDAEFVDSLLDKLAMLRRELKESTEKADAIRELMAKTAESEALEERISQIAQLALRVVATLVDVDSRLGEFADRLADTQTRGQQLKAKTSSYIVTAEICAILLFTWMAAGQFCLFRYGWTNPSRRRSAP
jgi:chromosome segregation ATPase